MYLLFQFQVNRNYEIEICEFKMHLKNFFCLRSNLSNDDIISANRQGLKMGVENDIFWSSIQKVFYAFLKKGDKREDKQFEGNCNTYIYCAEL